jgi:outer membrane protein assembly factor BamB
VTTIDNVGAPTPEGVKACPGTLGGVEWNGNAFDPINKSLYVGAVDWCTEFKSGPVKYVPGEAFSGGTKKQVGKATGWVTSINSDNGEIRWKYEAGSAMVAGMTPTAGNILFSGSMGGSFFALDSLSGKPLFTFNTEGAIAGGVITYLQKDKQYVATTSGNVSRSSQSFNPLSLGAPTVIIFALP